MATPKITPTPMPAFADVLRPEDCDELLWLILVAPVVAEVVSVTATLVGLPVLEIAVLLEVEETGDMTGIWITTE
jgi:hypothetical protein